MKSDFEHPAKRNDEQFFFKKKMASVLMGHPRGFFLGPLFVLKFLLRFLGSTACLEFFPAEEKQETKEQEKRAHRVPPPSPRRLKIFIFYTRAWAGNREAK